MNLTIFFSVLLFLKGLCCIINWMTAKKVENKKDYFISSKNISFLPLTMTLMGAVLGGGSVIGSAEESFVYGWSFLVYPLGFCLGFILIGFVSGKKLYEMKISTIAQIFESIYQSTALKKIASILSIFSLFLILSVQIIAAKKFFFAFGIENPFIFLCFWFIVFSYTVVGGFKAVITAHVIQTTFFAITLFLSLFYVLNNQVTFTPSPVNLDQISKFDSSRMLGWFLMPMLYFLISQDIGQRCFAAKSRKTVVYSCIAAGILVFVIMLIPIFFGYLAAYSQIIPKQGVSILMTTVSTFTNPVMTALVGSAVIAALTSSAESLINATGSNIYNDFNLSKYFPKLSAMKVISFVIAVSSLVIAEAFDNVINIVIFSYGLSVSTLFVPIIISFFRIKGNPISALYAICGGGITFLYFCCSSSASPVGFQLICLLVSFVSFYIGEFQIYFFNSQQYPLSQKDI